MATEQREVLEQQEPELVGRVVHLAVGDVPVHAQRIESEVDGGGQIADYYIDILRRPYISHWHMRYGQDLKTPQGSIQGPKVMLIDETAGSGGDLLPYMFRKFGVGTLVGTRTWGGLVGTLGYPALMDGGYVTAPNVAIWTMEEGFCVENVGVPPDIEVEMWPKDVIAGRDPQRASPEVDQGHVQGSDSKIGEVVDSIGGGDRPAGDILQPAFQHPAQSPSGKVRKGPGAVRADQNFQGRGRSRRKQNDP